MTSENADMATRLARLERSMRRSRLRTVGAVITLLAIWAVVAWSEDPQEQKVLRTDLLIIEDSEGRERIVIGAPMPDGRDQVGMRILSPEGAEQFGLGLKPDGSVGMGFDTKPGVGHPGNRERLNMGVTETGEGWIRYLDNQTRARMFLKLDSTGAALVQFLEWPDDQKIMVRQLTFSDDEVITWDRE